MKRDEWKAIWLERAREIAEIRRLNIGSSFLAPSINFAAPAERADEERYVFKISSLGVVLTPE